MDKKQKELLDKIANLRSRTQEILDSAKAEKRSLTGEESIEFDLANKEIEMLRSQWAVPQTPIGGQAEPQESIQQRFAKAVAAAYDKKQGVELEVRAINAEAVVHDTSVSVLQQDLMKPLEKGLILNKLGCHIMTNVQGEPMWPFVDGAEASVLDENAEVTDTQLTFTSIKSTPKRISMSYAVSNRAINQSNLNLHALVMEGLGMGVARKLNHIAFDQEAHGAYSGPFVGLSGVQALSRASKTEITFDEIVGLEHSVLNSLTDNLGSAGGYVMNYKTAQKLRVTPIVVGQSAMILDMFHDVARNTRYGVMNGYRVEFSNYVPDGLIYFGDFSYLGIPQYGGMSIVVDPYSLKKKNAVEFTLNTEMDMIKIRNEAFALSKPKP